MGETQKKIQTGTEELAQDFNFWTLMKFVFPSIFTFVFIALYQMVDGFFIEKFVGDIAIGAVNLYMPLLGLLVAIGIMLGSGANAIIVKKVGEGKLREAGKTFSNVILFSVIIGAILTIVGTVFCEPLMRLCGATEGNIEFLRPYYLILTTFSMAILLQSELGMLIIGEGKSVQAAIVIIVGGLINCVLDFILMKFFKLGIKGAAIATVLGYLSTIVYATYYYLVAKKSKYMMRSRRIDFREIREICFNGSSDMVSNLAMGVTALFMNHLAFKYYGEIGVSSLSVILYLQFLIEAVFMGFTSAVEPIFSYHYGSGDMEKRKKVFKLSNLWILILSVTMSLTVLILRRELVGIFFIEGTEIFRITEVGLFISLFAGLFVGFNIFFSGLFTAFSNGLVSAVLSFMRTFVILTICLYTLSYGFGGKGLWAAWPAAEILSFGFSLFFVVKYKKQYQYL